MIEAVYHWSSHFKFPNDYVAYKYFLYLHLFRFTLSLNPNYFQTFSDSILFKPLFSSTYFHINFNNGSSKTSLRELTFNFNNELTDTPVLEFPLFVQLEALPHEPPTDWSMKPSGWPHLWWTDPINPPSLEGLEGIHFIPFDPEGSSDTIKSYWLLGSLFKFSTWWRKVRPNLC